MFWKESKQSAFPSLPFYGDIHDIPCVREKSLKGSTNWSEQLQRNKTLITTTMTFSPTRRSELTCLQNYFPLDLFFEATGKVIRKAKESEGEEMQNGKILIQLWVLNLRKGLEGAGEQRSVRHGLIFTAVTGGALRPSATKAPWDILCITQILL